MTRTRTTRRRYCRKLPRRPLRRVSRSCVHFAAGSAGRQNYLGQALAAFRRAIRAHRRLARLAPHLFDFAEVDRERHEREERRRWRAIWEPALNKIYGQATPSEQLAELEAEQLPKLHPRTERTLEREWLNWNFWITAGNHALVRHHQRRPHALISFNQIAGLLDVGVAFQRLACGRDSSKPPKQPLCENRSWQSDLARAYG